MSLKNILTLLAVASIATANDNGPDEPCDETAPVAYDDSMATPVIMPAPSTVVKEEVVIQTILDCGPEVPDCPSRQEEGEGDCSNGDCGKDNGEAACPGEGCPEKCEGENCPAPPCDGEDCAPEKCDGDSCPEKECSGESCPPPTETVGEKCPGEGCEEDKTPPADATCPGENCPRECHPDVCAPCPAEGCPGCPPEGCPIPFCPDHCPTLPAPPRSTPTPCPAEGCRAAETPSLPPPPPISGAGRIAGGVAAGLAVLVAAALL
ncbi:hypothetical protein N3K66_006411 [Trichothecium roseum]|uniref:Uncharacterized protein n=1 Tax=Trichothecium roseum TaxID=47278 RepID=A0ACC0UWF0_9HYPO|nr:hypothetical protein N3K66_006411 [Trichothecium roseum]